MAKKNSAAAEEAKPIYWKYQPGQDNEGFPWGPHKLPLEMNFEGVNLVVEKHEGGFLYRREGRGESIDKIILSDKGSLLLSPVEPFYLPVGISNHLLIAFEQPIMVEPRTTRDALVTFPLELVSVIDRRRAGRRILDTFTLCRPKFTLYGRIKDGLICKYWQSKVYNTIPSVNPLEYGVMQLAIQNTSARWVEVQKAIFSAQGMKIYFSQSLVSLKATMKISSENTAETNFVDEPLQAGMNKALELFSTRLLSLPGKTVMEEGY